MRATERRQAIMAMLLGRGTATVDELAAQFSVSKMTVHRDLDALQSDGLLRKVRGGATLQPNAQFESDYRYRQTQSVADKRRIAEAAAELIEPGQTVIIDDSTTAGTLVDHVSGRLPLTVITNNVTVVNTLAGTAGLEIICLGGNYSSRFHAFLGLGCEDALRSLRADVAFLSASSVHDGRVFHQNQEVVQTKRLMLAAADVSHLLVDPSKFGRPALHLVSQLAVFDSVITSEAPPETQAIAVATSGVRLRTIGATGTAER